MTTVEYTSKQERKEKVLQLIQKGDWRAVIQEYEGIDEYREPLLVWIRPPLACLTFIQQQLTILGLDTVSSVGCGCGTLEWLLQAATGVRVRGYEVNRQWWEGTHSTPHYITMEYVDEMDGKTCTIPASSAIMFCYFNSLDYFHTYLQDYKGPCVILIGPVDGVRHCEPEPKYLMNQSLWFMMDTLALRGEDMIAVYGRK